MSTLTIAGNLTRDPELRTVNTKHELVRRHRGHSQSTEPRRGVVLAAPGAGRRNRLLAGAKSVSALSRRGSTLSRRGSTPRCQAVGPLAGWPDDGCDR
jgi:hypothetical protein